MVSVLMMLVIIAIPGILVAAIFFGTSAKALYYGGVYSIIIVACLCNVVDAVRKFFKNFKEEADNWDD